jgi:hypothetical protein
VRFLCAALFCAWLNLVERSVRVGEAVGSTPAAQTDLDSSECRLAAKPPVLGTGFREFDSLHSDRLRDAQFWRCSSTDRVPDCRSERCGFKSRHFRYPSLFPDYAGVAELA